MTSLANVEIQSPFKYSHKTKNIPLPQIPPLIFPIYKYNLGDAHATLKPMQGNVMYFRMIFFFTLC